jgi:hypothetical protein
MRRNMDLWLVLVQLAEGYHLLVENVRKFYAVATINSGEEGKDCHILFSSAVE